MKTYPQTMTAGQTATFEGGRYFEILEAAAPLNVQFIRRGSLGEKADDVLNGYYATPVTPFDAVHVSSASAQNIVIAISDGSGGYRRLSGNVTVTEPAGPTDKADVAVPAVSTALVSAASASKRETLITNLASNTAPIRVGGATVAAGRGTQVGPGQTATMRGTGAVYVYNEHSAAQSVGIVEITG